MIPFLDVVVGKECVALELVQFLRPMQAASGVNPQNGRRLHGIGAKIPVTRKDGIGFVKIGGHSGEIADVAVLQHGEIRRRQPRVRRADQNVRRDQFAGHGLKIVEPEIKLSAGQITVLDKFLRAALGNRNLHRKFAVVVVRERNERDAGLPQIIFTHDALGASLAFAQRRQQQRGEDGDDRDDDEQFHQRERARLTVGSREIHAACNLAIAVPRHFQREMKD